MSYLYGRNDHRILMVGLDGAGKSSILRKVTDKENRGLLHEHEYDLNLKRYYHVSRPFGILAVGAASFNYIRKSDCDAFRQTDGVIFVIDSSDESSLPKAADLLATLSQNEILSTAPLLILANKSDLGPAPSLEVVSRALLGLSSASSKRHRAFQHMVLCSTVTGKGLRFVSDWLAFCLSNPARKEQALSFPLCRWISFLGNLQSPHSPPNPHYMVGLRCMDSYSHLAAFKVLKWGVNQPHFRLHLGIDQIYRFQYDRTNLSFYCGGWSPDYIKALVIVVNSADDEGLKACAREIGASVSNSDVSLPRVPLLVWTERQMESAIKSAHEVADKLGLDRLQQPWLVQPYQSDPYRACSATGEHALYRSLEWLCWAMQAIATASRELVSTGSSPNATSKKPATQYPDCDQETISTVSTQDDTGTTARTSCIPIHKNATSEQQETEDPEDDPHTISVVVSEEEKGEGTISDLTTANDVSLETCSIGSSDSDWAIIDLEV